MTTPETTIPSSVVRSRAPDVRPHRAVLRRELIEISSARQYPVWLAANVAAATLVLVGLGSVGLSAASPSRVGGFLFQLYFSCLFILTGWVGVVVGCISTAKDRSGPTQDLLLITPCSVDHLVRAKAFASFLQLTVMLCCWVPPASVLLLFGGVTLAELVYAFLCLLVFGLGASSFGVMLGARLRRPARGWLTASAFGLGISASTYLLAGLLGGALARQLWTEVSPGTPVWLPLLYAEAPLDASLGLLLLLLPLVTMGFALWLMDLSSARAFARGSQVQDRTPFAWYLVSTPSFTGIGLAMRRWVIAPVHQFQTDVLLLALLFAQLLLGLWLLAGDSRHNTRRVASNHVVTALHVLEPALPVLLTGVCGLAVTATAALRESRTAPANVGTLLAGCAYLLGTGLFLTAIVERAKLSGRQRPRKLLAWTLLGLLVGPPLVALIAFASGLPPRTAWWLVAPSPAFVGLLHRQLSGGISAYPMSLTAGLVSGLFATTGAAIWYRALRRRAPLMGKTPLASTAAEGK